MANRAKPSFPQLNRSHPLSQGLVLDFPLFEGAGTKSSDAVSGITGTIAGSSFVSTPYGYALSARGNTVTTDKLTFVPVPRQMNTPLTTVEVLTYTRGYGTFGTLFNDGIDLAFDSGVPNKMLIYAGFTTTDGYWRVPYTLNQWNHIVVTHDSSSSANNPSCWINGVAQSVSRDVGPSGSKKTDDTTHGIGCVWWGNRAYEGNIVYVRKWNRLLSAQEVAQLYADPFQIYNKRNSWLSYYTAPAAAATTRKLSLLGVG